MNSALVSIIVPVYRVEYWLPKCIKSLLAQTYKNIEIILVDDGSPDKSGTICDKFAKKDSRIKVIHKENGGVSSARNAGIDAAEGEYICFVDSDDWLSEDAIETLYAEFLKNNVQIVIANMITVGKRNGLFRLVNKERIISFNDPDNLFLDLYQESSLGGLVNKLFVASLIKDNTIRLKEGMKFGEDVLFLLECFKHCSAISLIEKPIYYYNRLVSESAITRYYPELTDWMLVLTEARHDLVNEKGEQYKNGLLYVAKTALIDFEYIINCTCLKKIPKTEAIKIFEKAYDAFKPYFYPDLLKAGTVEYCIYDRIIEKYCKTSDFCGLYQKTQQKYILHPQKLKGRLKSILAKGYFSLKRRMYKYIL
ncbi:MAG: glycosyltransferase family 2 protein [Clostridia bacterium]|nr:glycosyltransferase family 2 protein [Clostridia bacterium]